MQDVDQFSTMFLNYDLLAKRWMPDGKVYPYGEALAGILMTAGILPWISAPVALFIGTIGPVSVFKAVYIDKRELTCACVGGGSNVPLGFILLTENLMMMFMGIWMGVPSPDEPKGDRLPRLTLQRASRHSPVIHPEVSCGISSSSSR